MDDRTDVLLFVEDPGAANYASAIPDALALLGLSARLLAAGTAADYLRERGIPCERLGASARARPLLEAIRPGLVAVGTAENPRAFGLELVDAAREAGLPSVGLVDGFANAAFRFRGTGASPRAHGPDWLAVPDAPTAEAYVSLGWDPGRVGICGHPRWDEVRLSAKAMAARDRRAMRQRLFPLCAPERPVVLFAAEISEGLDPGQYRRSPAYTLEGGPGSQGRTEIVLDEFLDAAAALRPEPYLVLRLHPKQGPDSLVAYRAAFDQISSGGDPLEILYACDAVVGMTSMLLQEAALLGRATLSIVPREEEKAWLPTIAMGITPCASRRPEVREGLGRAVAGRRSEAALRFAAAGDSGCAGAVAAWLARIAEGRGRAPAGARTG